MTTPVDPLNDAELDAAAFEAEAAGGVGETSLKRKVVADSGGTAASPVKRSRDSSGGPRDPGSKKKPNASLQPRASEQLALLKKIANENGCNPAAAPDIKGGKCEWKVDSGRLKLLNTNSQTSFQVVTPVADVILFFNDDSVSVRLTSPRGNNQESDFVLTTVNAFGPQLVDKLCEPGVATELSKTSKIKSMRLQDKKTGGTNPKLKEALLKDLDSPAGERPSFMTNLSQKRHGKNPDDPDSDGPPEWWINFSKTRYSRRRPENAGPRTGDAPCGVPPEIAEAFEAEGKMDHPVVKYFQDNKDVDPNPFPVSAADATPMTCWQFLASASLPTRTGGYWAPALVQLRLGGCNCAFLKEYNLFKLTLWNNGMTVFGLPNYGEAQSEPAKQANLDMYAALDASGM